MLTARSLGLVFLIGPLAALLGLQLAVCASSRVNDPRSAQQLGAFLIIIPVGVLQVAQFVGGVVLTAPILLAIGAALAAGNLLVLRAAISIFDRESILDPMEIDQPVAVGHPFQGSIAVGGRRLVTVVVKHVRDAFVDERTIAAQWKALNFAAAPDLGAAIDEYEQFLEILRSSGTTIHLLPRDPDATLDSIYARDASIVSPKG